MARKQQYPQAILTIKTTHNNTFATLTCPQGNVLKSVSAGQQAVGLKGARKGTPFAASSVVEVVLKAAKEEFGVQIIKQCRIHGYSSGRDQAFGPLRKSSIKIDGMVDITPVNFGGCRPRKARRV